MSVISCYRKLSLSKKIYIATVMGLFFGMFFGDRCGVLEPFNVLFIRLFQITIIPYMIFSILHSIGSLTVENAKLIGRKGGLVLLGLWLISICFAFGLQYSFPDIERNKFFRPEEALKGTGVNFYDLFVPSNPFYSIANGYIPAIVIFSILIGMALIQEEKKAKLLEYAGVLASLMKRVNDYITVLLPVGVLVMSTYTFGSLSFIKFKGVLLYIFASIFYLVFISLIIYPVIISSVSKIKFKQFLHYSIPAALIAFTTGSVFLALPVIYNLMYKFDDDEKGYCSLVEDKNEKGRNLISIVVPLAWVVPASYKFLVIFFIVFAHWYYNYALPISEEIMYYLGGVPCLFGNNSIIVPFLLDITDLPNKAYNVFMLVSSLMVYFNNANGAIFIVTCSMLCYLFIRGKLRVRWSKLILLLIGSILLFSAVVMELSLLMTTILSGDDEIKQELTHMNLQPYNKKYYSMIESEYLTLDQYHYIAPLNSQEELLDKIVRSRTLQVGYNPEAVPFSFFNTNGMLVGYDIDFIYDIAENLQCTKIEFYPVYNYAEYNNLLSKDIILDICVGGYQYRGNIVGKIITSEPYMKFTPAIVISNSRKDEFNDFESAFLSKDINVGVLDGTYLLTQKLENRFIRSHRLIELQKISDFYLDHKSDSLLINAETAFAINIIYHGYWVLPYEGEDIKLFFGFLFPYGDKIETFRDMVNAWISVCYRNNIYKERYNYWIEGEADIQIEQPWSVLSWLQKNNYFLRIGNLQKTNLLNH